MYKKIFLISVVFVLIAIYFESSFLHIFQNFFSKFKPKVQDTLFTTDSLKLYNGIDKPELYLAILGNVFDVSKGTKHYGPGESYNFFIGKDASRSFVTGKFGENDADDQVADLNAEELLSLNDWLKFYSREYKRIGKLIGRYYDQDGHTTRYAKEVKRLIKQAKKSKESGEAKKILYPPCNIEWDPDRGTRVWCTNKSGGILRDWVGVPRQLYEPGSNEYRCACVKSTELTANLKYYEGCDNDLDSCFVKEDDHS